MIVGTSLNVFIDFMRFVAQNNQKSLFLHIQLEKMMSEICKVQMNDLKTFLYVFDWPNSCELEACSGSKMFPMIISNSGK